MLKQRLFLFKRSRSYFEFGDSNTFPRSWDRAHIALCCITPSLTLCVWELRRLIAVVIRLFFPSLLEIEFQLLLCWGLLCWIFHFIMQQSVNSKEATLALSVWHCFAEISNRFSDGDTVWQHTLAYRDSTNCVYWQKCSWVHAVISTARSQRERERWWG